jgi:hypothetical protein
MSEHIVEIGDTLYVKGHAFIVTSLFLEQNMPAVLTTKQPIELLEVRRD